MTNLSKDELDRYAQEATDREMERRLRRMHRQDRPSEQRDTGAPKGIYFPPHIERRRRLFYAELAQAGVISGWGVATGNHAPPDMAPGRDGQLFDMSHWIATTEDEYGRATDKKDPNKPDTWARLDTSHPIERMFRRGSLAKDGLVADARYKAAIVWMKFFERAAGIGGGPGFCQDAVDGSSDPMAAMLARLEASEQRDAVRQAPGMTAIRFRDLDSVVGAGHSITQRAKATGRVGKSVRKSLFAALDAVSGFPKWASHLERVQVQAAFEHRRQARKKIRKAS